MSTRAAAQKKDSSMNKSAQKKSSKSSKAAATNAQVDPDVLYQDQLNERYYINPMLQDQHRQEDLVRIREKLAALILATHENMNESDLGSVYDGSESSNYKKEKVQSNNTVCNFDFSKPIDATFPAVHVYKLPYLLNALGLHMSNEQVNQIAAMTTHKLLKGYLININNSSDGNASNLQEWNKEFSKLESTGTADFIDIEKLVHIIHEIHVHGFFTYVPEPLLETNKTEQDDNAVNENNKNEKKSKKIKNNKKLSKKKSLEKEETEEMTEKEQKTLLLHMTDNTLEQIFEALWVACGKQTKVPELSEIDKTPVRCIHKEAMRELFMHKPTGKNQKLTVAVNEDKNNEQQVDEVKKEGEQINADNSLNNNNDTNKSSDERDKWTSVSSLFSNNKFSTNVMTQEEIENFLFHCTDASGEWIYESAFLERLHDVQN